MLLDTIPNYDSKCSSSSNGEGRQGRVNWRPSSRLCVGEIHKGNPDNHKHNVFGSDRYPKSEACWARRNLIMKNTFKAWRHFAKAERQEV